MVLITSVFLVQLLCVIVPCDPRFRLPDLSSDPHKLYQNEDYKGLFIKKKVGISALESELGDSNLIEADSHKLPPFVRTLSGDVEGYYMKVVGGREISAFEGIPYGEPPTGSFRFKPPRPKGRWKGILFAKDEGPPCLQYNVPRAFRVFGTEDCLSMNVYSAQLPSYSNPKPKLPVIVFIHGGGFFFGSTRAYGPSYLMQKNIVLCSFQYRLGILGFMSTGDAASPGNWGLKDQVLALKWIYENIERFGGDPENITIMGQSAGSVFVHYHMLSHQSRRYFRRAASLSGTAFNYWAIHFPYQARNITNTLADLVGCPNEDSYKLVECLRNTNTAKLTAQTPQFLDDWPYPSNAFRPTIEELSESNPDPFITDSPISIYQKNDVAKVPWIVTFVSGEGYSFLLFPYITFAFKKVLRKNWYKLAPDLVDIDNFEDLDFATITRKLTKMYFKNTPPEKASIHQYAKMVTDRTFLTGVYKAAQAHSQVAPTYSYVFDYNGQYNAITNYGYPRSEWGVGHAEDIFYLFNSSTVYQGFKREDPEFEISQTLVNIIYNFASKSEPLYTAESGEDIRVWEPHNGPHDMNFFKISNSYIKMVGDPFKKRIRFWDKLGIPDNPREEEVLYRYTPQIPNYGEIEDNSFKPYDPFQSPLQNK